MLTQQNLIRNPADGFKTVPSPVLTLIAFFIFMTVNWRIMGFHLGIDAAMRIPMILGFILFCFISKSVFKVNAVKLWGGWILYAFCNALLCGLNRNAMPTVFDLIVQLGMPFLMLCASLYCTVVNQKQMLRFMFIAVLFHCAEMTWGLGIIQNFSLINRINSANGVNANEIGLYLSFLLLLGISLYYQEGKKYFPLFLLFWVVDFLLILVTASRTAFVIAAVGFFLVLFFADKKIMKKLTFLAVFAYVLVNILNYADDILLIERLKNTEGELSGNEEMGDSFIAKHLGDRGVYYYYGSEIFAANPVHGVGFSNYILHNPYSAHICHVEIMAQLSEEGILGTVLFLLFYISIGKDFYRTKKDFSSLRWWSSFVFFVMICATDFASYVSSRPFYFLFFGYISGCLYLLKNEEQPEITMKDPIEESIS